MRAQSRTLVVSAAALLLAACASTPPAGPLDVAAWAPPVDRQCEKELPLELSMQFDLVEKMLQGGRPRAALAHLQTVPAAAKARPEAIYLSAEAYRRIGDHDFAAERYSELLRGCLAGYGHRGMGLVRAQQGRFDEALRYLQQAAALEPIDADIRNDLGFALLELGQLEAAAAQFATAVELQVTNGRAQQNLVLSRLMQNRRAEARSLARRFELPVETLQALEQEAERRTALRSEIQKEDS
mgnify:CR=1 FL=1